MSRKELYEVRCDGVRNNGRSTTPCVSVIFLEEDRYLHPLEDDLWQTEMVADGFRDYCPICADPENVAW